MSAATWAYRIVRYSGLPWLFREVLFRNRVRIIMFHDPDLAAMDRALTYLGKRYSIITLEDLFADRELPTKPLVITLDDGHRGNAALLPAFRKHGVRPTIFLCSGLIGTNRHFWFLHKPGPGPSEDLKQLPDHQRLQAMNTVGHTPQREFSHPQALGVAQIEELKCSVDLQSHGVYHPCLTACTDEEARKEIFRSKQQLEEQFGLPINAFAFPNGDYCTRDLDLVREAGYACALTVDYGFNDRRTDRFRLKRLSIDDSGNIDGVSAKASGVWTLLRILIGRQRCSRALSRPITTRGPVRPVIHNSIQGP